MDKRSKKIIKSLHRRLHGESTGGWLEVREQLRNRLEEIAEDGQVALVCGGRDCDGVQVDGIVKIIPAQVMQVALHEREEERNADGPWWYSMWRVSEVDSVEYSSRDLAMEAYEDGHPHVLYV